jgi:hypothetical protein
MTGCRAVAGCRASLDRGIERVEVGVENGDILDTGRFRIWLAKVGLRLARERRQ